MREPFQLDVTEVTCDPVVAVTSEVTSLTNGPAMASAMTVAMGRLLQYARQYRLNVVGAPRAVYTSLRNRTITFTLALPIDPPPDEPPATVHARVAQLNGFRGWRFEHVGPYETLPTTYARITQWLLEREAIASEDDWDHLLPMWEEYVSDPARTPPAELHTSIYVPGPSGS